MRVISQFLPVASPLAITSAAAFLIDSSLVSTLTSGLSLVPRSSTSTARHSVSSCAGLADDSVVFMSSSILFSHAGNCKAREAGVSLCETKAILNYRGHGGARSVNPRNTWEQGTAVLRGKALITEGAMRARRSLRD